MTTKSLRRGEHATLHGLGTLLRMPYQAMVSGAVEPALAMAGFGDVRAAHLPVIQALAMNPEGLRSTELATYARITKQSMGYLVDHLSTSGYVERVPDPGDQRAKVVRLTPTGWQVSQTIRSTVLGVEAAWAEQIGPDRMKQLKAILRDLVSTVTD
ncbi:MAG: MarR family winged helix-turn-helix transcriptional regulator [Thermomicrobiales bacterium]